MRHCNNYENVQKHMVTQKHSNCKKANIDIYIFTYIPWYVVVYKQFTSVKIVCGRHLLSHTQQDAVALSHKAHQFAADRADSTAR